MARLHRSDCSQPGIVRRRRGRGFAYYDAEGRRIDDPDTIEWVRSLTIPPAWRDVWICPSPRGHLQATGFDGAGRKQYLYHPRWRERQEQKKFQQIIDFARALPGLRKAVDRELRATDRLTQTRVLACCVRMLDLGFFRIGSEEYADEEGGFGLATLRPEHVTVKKDGELIFDFLGKAGQRQIRTIDDDAIYPIIARLKRRRHPGELMAYQQAGSWRDIRSTDVNAFLKSIMGDAVSAKDFRTWHATVLAAVGVARRPDGARSQTSRKRAISETVKEVAYYLGNTPAVCRASYIDPRVFDAFRGGVVIKLPSTGVTTMSQSELLVGQAKVEQAVIDLIDPAVTESPALEEVA